MRRFQAIIVGLVLIIGNLLPIILPAPCSLFKPVLHARGKQGFKVLDGLLHFRLLLFYLLYALSKELLKWKWGKRNGKFFKFLSC